MGDTPPISGPSGICSDLNKNTNVRDHTTGHVITPVATKDSGIGESQVFFPPNFSLRSDARVSTPLTPSLTEHGGVETATKIGCSSGQSHIWRWFLLFWVTFSVMLFLGMHVWDQIQNFYWLSLERFDTCIQSEKCLIICLEVVAFVCSALVVLLVTRFTSSVSQLPNQQVFPVSCTGDFNGSANLGNFRPTPRDYSAPVNESTDSMHGAGATNNTSLVTKGACVGPVVHDFPCRRTFSGHSTDVWHDFRKYFTNIAQLNNWSSEYSRKTLLCSLRGQAETFVYGLPEEILCDWDKLIEHLDQRFGTANMKGSYIIDARSRRKQRHESYREFAQAVEDLFRRAYPDHPEMVRENALTIFLDNCHESRDFRMSVKRTRPTTLLQAVESAMQEEFLRADEKIKEPNPSKVYKVGQTERNNRGVKKRNQTGTENNTSLN